LRSTHKLAILCTTVLIALNAVSASTAELEIFPSQSSTKVDSFTSYEVEITNTGTAEDIYDITSSNPSEIRIAPREVPNSDTLSPGQSETIQVWYNPDTGSSEGNKEFTVTATSQANGEKYSTQGTVEIIKDHQVNIQVEGPDSVCREEEAVYEVSVTNTGTQTETFRLQADAGDFSQNSIELERDETKTVELVRSSDIAVTDRSFNINAESTSSYAEAFTSTSFNVETCYESEATLNPDSQRTAALTETEFEVEVSNQGTRTDTFNLTTTHGELEQETIDVASGDTVTTDLTYTPEQPENKNIEITATGESTSTVSSTLNVYNGQNVSVNFDSNSQNVCERETFEKQVTVENTGAVEDTYTLQDKPRKSIRE
jgi:MSP (Major sperm protein) domain.